MDIRCKKSYIIYTALELWEYYLQFPFYWYYTFSMADLAANPVRQRSQKGSPTVENARSPIPNSPFASFPIYNGRAAYAHNI